MPLRQIREICPHVYLGFWEISEEPEELHLQLKILTQDNQTDIPIFTSEVRQRQWLASRVLVYTLLQRLSSEQIVFQTNAAGKPIFPESSFRVSISHCQNLAAVILSDAYEVGIDIEIISPKVMRVRNKFMTDTEKNDAAEDVEKTLIYWSGKETLYKLYSKRQLIFKDNLFIKPFSKARAGTVAAQITAPDIHKNYILHYEVLDQHILTYSIDC